MVFFLLMINDKAHRERAVPWKKVVMFYILRVSIMSTQTGFNEPTVEKENKVNKNK